MNDSLVRWPGPYTVYTTLFGRGAPLTLPGLPLVPGSPAPRCVVITDHPTPALEIGEPWELLRVPKCAEPQRMARYYKTHPKLIARPEDVATVWQDATFVWRRSPDACVAEVLARGWDIGALKHPDRSRMVTEAAEVARVGLASRARVQAQVQAYQADGFDTDAQPLRAVTTTGLLVRQRNDRTDDFDALWAEQQARYTLRDQISVDYVAWRLGIVIGYLEGHYRQNPYARYLSVRRTPRPRRVVA